MDKKTKTINAILEEFLREEASAADERIICIRRFIAALDAAAEKYGTQRLDGPPAYQRERFVKIIEDMADIYRREISDLLVKRGKLCEYLLSVRSSILLERENDIKAEKYVN